MHNSGSNYRKNLFVPRVLLILTGVELGVAALFYGYWGFKAGNSNTMSAAH